MKYLLIDFGASKIQTLIYDKESDSCNKVFKIESPFLTNSTLSLHKLKSLLIDIINKYPNDNIDGIIPCTILGGGWGLSDKIYYSWKVKSQNKFITKGCLISGLFFDEENYHIHKHHDKKGYDGLKILGNINNIPIYSSMGDTNCVKNSFTLGAQKAILNLGTGSQIIMEDKTISFIPSGRALNVYKNFFDKLDVDLFQYFHKLTLKDLKNSNLEFNLNIFPQSRNWKPEGGHILNIKEDNFNLHNIISSLFKCYIDQYIKLINKYNLKKIYLTGGINEKYSLVGDYIRHKTSATTVIRTGGTGDVFVGMVNFIKKHI